MPDQERATDIGINAINVRPERADTAAYLRAGKGRRDVTISLGDAQVLHKMVTERMSATGGAQRKTTAPKKARESLKKRSNTREKERFF